MWIQSPCFILLIVIAAVSAKPNGYGGNMPPEAVVPNILQLPINTESIAPVVHHAENAANPKIDLPPFKVSSYAAPIVPPSPADYEATEAPTVTTTLKPLNSLRR